MTPPLFTPRGFWVRVLAFGAGLLVYLWAVLIMLRERSLIGVLLLCVLALFNLTGLLATLRRRPRPHDQ